MSCPLCLPEYLCLSSALPQLLFHSYFDRTIDGNRRLLYEVHFTRSFVPYHPWGATPNRDGTLQLDILRVCHATHQAQAAEIRQGDGSYHFQPHQKVGKAYIPDGRPLGESYSYDQIEKPHANTVYQPICKDNEVFPGCYSWWGLAVDPDVLPNRYQYFDDDLPDYLRYPPASVYGTRAFVSTFPNILQQYALSRDCEVTDLYLKMGGTLRYKHEIAYVVIICTSRDHDLRALENYPSITEAPPDVFNPNGLVDEHGNVTNEYEARVPIFTTNYFLKKDNEIIHSSYETLDFAFYYQNEFGALRTAAGTLEEVTIAKGRHYCTRTQPQQVTGVPGWNCPDKI